MFVALPSFDENFPDIGEGFSCPVGKAVETCFAIEVNLGDTPGMFVPLTISELIEFRIWECRGLPVGCNDCSCEFADSKVDALPGKLVGALNSELLPPDSEEKFGPLPGPEADGLPWADGTFWLPEIGDAFGSSRVRVDSPAFKIPDLNRLEIEEGSGPWLEAKVGSFPEMIEAFEDSGTDLDEMGHAPGTLEDEVEYLWLADCSNERRDASSFLDFAEAD